MVILDTNIIIDHLRKPSDESLLTKMTKNHSNETLGISVISIQELYEGKSTKDLTKENFMLSILGLLTVLPYDAEVAKLAGKIARDSSESIDLGDTAIAATTILNGASLLTLNEKHFESIPDLNLFSL